MKFYASSGVKHPNSDVGGGSEKNCLFFVIGRVTGIILSRDKDINLAIGLKESGWSNSMVAGYFNRSDATILQCWQERGNHTRTERQEDSSRMRPRRWIVRFSAHSS
ncbi:hypothetical protein TNCV_249811 [Trichonephila clavipes]|nr:hypothetical protein TNCV_249811 [Trichonephila clavipes]